MATRAAHALVPDTLEGITLTGHLSRAPVETRAEAIGDLNHRVGNRLVTRQILREMAGAPGGRRGNRMLSVTGRPSLGAGRFQTGVAERPRVRW